MAVYDDQKADDLNDLLSPAEQRGSEDRAISDYASGGMGALESFANNGRSEGDAAPGSMAAGILAKERDAAKGGLGKNLASGGGKAASGAASGAKAAAGGAASKAGLAALESAVPAAAAATAAAAAADSLTKGLVNQNGKKISRNRAILAVGGILIFGGGGIGLFSMVSQPFMALQAGQLIKQLWNDPQTGQSDGRFMRIYRALKYQVKGTPQKTHMGMVGNLVADRINGKLERAGLFSDYSRSTGTFRGYVIDPKRIPGFGSGTTTQDAIKLLQGRPYNITAPISFNTDGLIVIGGEGLTVRQERQLASNAMKLAGYNRMVGAVAARIMGVRNSIGWKPIKKRINAAVESRTPGAPVQDDARYKEWLKEVDAEVRNGVKVAAPTTATRPGPDNQTLPEDALEGKSDLDSLTAEASNIGDDPAKLTAFQEKIATRLISGVGIAGLVCFFNFISKHFDIIYQNSVEVPMMRMAARIISLSEMIKDGYKLDGEQEQIKFEVNGMHDSRPGQESSWYDNQPLQHELGLPLSGVDVPPNAKVDPSGNAVTKALSAVPNIDEICEVVENPVAAVAVATFTVIVLRASGAGAIVQAILGAAGAAAATAIAGDIARTLGGLVVDVAKEGSPKGALWGYGAALESRAMALPNAGLPVDRSVSDAVKNQEIAIREGEFSQKSLAERLFDVAEPQSFIAQAMMRQHPNPRTSIANAGLNMLNIGKTFGKLATIPFSQPVAAASNYNYGFDNYLYTPEELEDERWANPLDNANKASDILDDNVASNPVVPSVLPNATNVRNYVYRAEKCFNVKLVKQAVLNPDTGNTEQLWKLLPPETKPDPLEKFLKDPANRCVPITSDNQDQYEGASVWGDKEVEDWNRIRFFIWDNNLMNAVGCYESDGTEPELTKTCIDVGLEKNPNPPAGGSAAGGANTGTGNLNFGDWKLTIPIGAEEIKQPELKTYESEWYKKVPDGQLLYVNSGAPGVGTTSNSSNPRSELREMKPGGKEEADWSSSGTHQMIVKERITQFKGGRNHVVVAQIHDAEDDTTVFRLEGTELWVTNGDTAHGHKVADIPIDANGDSKPFTVGFKVTDGTVEYYFSPTGADNPPLINYKYNAGSFSGAYFKAGSYYQGGTDGGTAGVIIMGIGVTHDGSVPNIAAVGASGGTPAPAGPAGSTAEPILGSDAPGGAIGSSRPVAPGNDRSVAGGNQSTNQRAVDGLNTGPNLNSSDPLGVSGLENATTGDGT